MRSNWLIQVSANIINAFLSVLPGILLARGLSIDQRGLLGVVQNFSNLLVTIGAGGMFEAILLRKKNSGTLRSNLFIATVVSIAVSILILLIGVGWIEGSPHSRLTIWYTVALIFTYPIYWAGIAGLRSLKKLKIASLFGIMPTAFWAISVISCYLLKIFELETILFVYIFLMGALAIFFIAKMGFSIVVKNSVFKNYLKLLLPNFIANIPSILNAQGRILILFISFIGDVESVAIFLVAQGWANIAKPIISALGITVTSTIASTKSYNNQLEKLLLFNDLNKVIVLVLSFLLILVTNFGIVFIYGGKYTSSIFPSIFLILSGIFAGLRSGLEDGCRGIGLVRETIMADITGIVSTLVLIGLFFGRIENLSLMYYSCLLSTVTSSIFYCLIIAKKLNFSLSEIFLLNKNAFIGFYNLWIKN